MNEEKLKEFLEHVMDDIHEADKHLDKDEFNEFLERVWYELSIL